MIVRLCGAAALLVFSMVAPAGAQNGALPETPAESRALLEQSCRADGMAAETCSCLGDFVIANFAERELAGAAMVLSNPLYTDDPAAGIAALLDAGYSLDEITGVVDRVMVLEEAATTACAVEGSSGQAAPGAE